ncbi:hypothetical protein [Streptomyces olivaceoviridis]|uniref:hypothetical protein n=1 Tax=Streptomyces olivaceoviridis TaxID=1921 RepID=UPI0036851662
MSEQNTDATAIQQNNAMPTPPAKDEPIATPNEGVPSEPAADETITTLNNAMPAGPALDLNGK